MSNKVVTTDLEAGVLHNSEWVDRWKVRNISFHQAVHAEILDKEEASIFEGKCKSIFAPLCGKSLDLKWMYDKGHTVIGVEIAEQAVQEFFSENNIDYDIQELENIGKLYKSKDGRMNLYVADLFDVTVDVVNQVDLIYDCRSLVAINTEDHIQYRDQLLSLMKADGKYYLHTVEYDDNVWPGPPHSTNDKVVRDLYGERCNISILEENIRKLNEGKEANQAADAEKPKSFGQAQKLLTFMAVRWYNMTFK